nr:PD-(D/E)XK nuclease family protein [Nocardioides daphniae]
MVGTEVPFSFTSTLPDGSQVHLRGFADRLEIDAQGRVVVVDLKTGKYPPTDKSLVENPQLGIYQYAVEHGGFSDALEEGALSGGAELWQLRASSKDVPKVQAQARQERDEEGWLLAERQLAETARVIRDEQFAAIRGKHCDFCAFTALCPATTKPGVIS